MLRENASADGVDAKRVLCVAGGALLNRGRGRGREWNVRENEGASDARQVGSIFTWASEKQQLGQGNGNNVPASLFCSVSKPEVLLQRNALLEAEFIATRLGSVKTEEFYVDRK